MAFGVPLPYHALGIGHVQNISPIDWANLMSHVEPLHVSASRCPPLSLDCPDGFAMGYFIIMYWIQLPFQTIVKYMHVYIYKNIHVYMCQYLCAFCLSISFLSCCCCLVLLVMSASAWSGLFMSIIRIYRWYLYQTHCSGPERCSLVRPNYQWVIVVCPKYDYVLYEIMLRFWLICVGF